MHHKTSLCDWCLLPVGRPHWIEVNPFRPRFYNFSQCLLLKRKSVIPCQISSGLNYNMLKLKKIVMYLLTCIFQADA